MFPFILEVMVWGCVATFILPWVYLAWVWAKGDK
jgi:hypothetical protein